MFYPNRFLRAFPINQNHMIKSLWTIKAFWGMLLRDCRGAADRLIVWPAVDSGADCNRGGSSSDKCPHSARKSLFKDPVRITKFVCKVCPGMWIFLYWYLEEMFREFKNIWGEKRFGGNQVDLSFDLGRWTIAHVVKSAVLYTASVLMDFKWFTPKMRE